MKLQKREQMLVAAAGGIIVFVGLIAFFTTADVRTDDFLRSEHERLQGEVRKKEKQVKDADEDARQLVEWRKRSLPRDAVIAQSQYRAWLLTLCNRAGLSGSEVHADAIEPHRDVYTRIPFSIRARADLGQIVTFLHGFYAAGHLQQIRRLEIKPLEKSDNDFDLHVSIEALSLRDADSSEKLAAEAGQPLLALADYSQTVVGRDFFRAYVQPGPPPPPPQLPSPPPEFAKLVFVTAIVQDKDDGKWQVWLYDRAAGKNMQLKEGDRFTARAGSGQVRSIVPDDKVIVQFNGKDCELELGDNLAGGKRL